MSVRAHLTELLVTVTLVLLLMLVAPAAPVHAATFTSPSLASYQGNTQAADAYQPTISGDGRYVFWVGSFDGVQGIYRKDVQTGALELVAGQQSGSLAGLSAPDAGSPAVSADGRYIAFTTTADLDPADDPQPAASCSNVYVRDMDVPIGDSGAYTLVSALDGSSAGLAYTLNSAGSACAAGGSASADRVAISADGNEVAFTVLGQSDLTTGSASDLTTPPDQVAVRYLDTQATMLVSQTMASEQDGGAPQPVPDGAALTTAGDAITTLVLLSNGQEFQQPTSASTAAISADGSTVAWMGIDIPEQAPAASLDEAPSSFPDQFDEPLWRDIALGSGAPTRRVTGGDDPDAPSGEGPFDEVFNADYTNSDASGVYVGPIFGTYTESQAGFGGATFSNPSLDAATPALSANGQEVAFLSNEPLLGHEPTAGPGETLPPWYANAYVVNMAPGLTRDQALTQLSEVTQETSSDPVNEIAISPSGTRVAFTTADISFPLASPALVTPPLSSASGLADAQLYDVDLTASTVSLVSYGYEGAPADGTVQSPSFTTDGDTLAFDSAAMNLVYGAQNDGTDVFTTTENTTPAIPGAVAISPLPLPALVPQWVLSVSASANKRKGTVRLTAAVPGQGTLAVTAKAVAPKGVKAALVAKGQVRSRGAGVVTLTLKASKAQAARLRRRAGLLTGLRVSFSAKGRRTLVKTLQLTLHEAKGKVKSHKKAAKPSHRRARTRAKAKGGSR